jgi:hypothetical protein
MESTRPAAPAIALLLTSLLAACGGGGGSAAPPPDAGPAIAEFTSDRTSYFVGERARLTAVYSGGTARIEPGSLPVASGQTIETPVLSERRNFRLIVTSGDRTAFRDRTLDVGYRERTRTVPAPFARAEHQSVVLVDGSVLIVGGDGGGSTLPESVWRFDPATETFAEFARLATGRVGHLAVSLPDDRVLVYGGERAVIDVPPAEILDARTRTVRPTLGRPSAATRRYAAAVPLTDGRVLIVGGATPGGAQPVAEVFDPVTEQFTAVPGGLAAARYAHTATRLRDGRVLVYGGYGPTGGTGPILPPELYDPATGRFTLLPAPETVRRANHAAVALDDGTLLIVGGEDDDGPLASVLRFDPTTLQFTRAADLLTGRAFARALVLNDGRVFTAGGDTPGAFATDSVELLRSDGVRRAGPALGTPRVLHTITPLVITGKALVFGGLDAGRNVLASAEIFE